MAIHLTDADAMIYEVPKTGTTFVRKVLEALSIEYSTPDPVVRSCPRHSPWWCYSECKKRFCIVRHPVSWYESLYKYHRFGHYAYSESRVQRKSNQLIFEPGVWYPHRLFWHRSGEMGLEFNHWIERITQFYPGAYTRIVDAFTGPLGYNAMDAVLRTETLREDLIKILGDLGYEFDHSLLMALAKQNTSEGEVSWAIFNRDRILNLEQAVLRRFYE